MLKKRVILLGVAVAAFGAILAGGAFANPTGTDNTPTSSNVGVTQPVVVATFQNQATAIPANGTFKKAADIYAHDNDPDYSMNVTAVTVVTPASQTTPTCGTVNTQVTPVTLPVGPISNTAPGTDVGDLEISIATTGTDNDCQVGGAVVKVDVEATGA
jgi:hypothetical protein